MCVSMLSDNCVELWTRSTELKSFFWSRNEGWHLVAISLIFHSSCFNSHFKYQILVFRFELIFFVHCFQRSIVYLAMLKTWLSAPGHYLTFRLNEPVHFKGGLSWNSMNLLCVLREAGGWRFMRDSLAACNFHVNKISCVLEEDVTFKLFFFFSIFLFCSRLRCQPCVKLTDDGRYIMWSHTQQIKCTLLFDHHPFIHSAALWESAVQRKIQESVMQKNPIHLRFIFQDFVLCICNRFVTVIHLFIYMCILYMLLQCWWILARSKMDQTKKSLVSTGMMHITSHGSSHVQLCFL